MANRQPPNRQEKASIITQEKDEGKKKESRSRSMKGGKLIESIEGKDGETTKGKAMERGRSS